MSEAEFENRPASGVSPARKMVSLVVLLGLLVVFVIELRAGLGQSQSVSALASRGDQGGLESADMDKNVLLSTLWFSPSEETTQENDQLAECEYTWFSIFQPLMQGASPSIKVLYDKSSDPWKAVEFKTPEPDGVDVGWARNFGDTPDSGFVTDVDEHGGMAPNGFVPGMNNGQGGGGGDFTQRLWQGMKRNPVMSAINKDGDDEISDEEIDHATDSLLELDTNKDGQLTEDELRPNGPPGSAGPVGGGGPDGGAGQRPPLDE